ATPHPLTPPPPPPPPESLPPPRRHPYPARYRHRRARGRSLRRAPPAPPPHVRATAVGRRADGRRARDPARDGLEEGREEGGSEVEEVCVIDLTADLGNPISFEAIKEQRRRRKIRR